MEPRLFMGRTVFRIFRLMTAAADVPIRADAKPCVEQLLIHRARPPANAFPQRWPFPGSGAFAARDHPKIDESALGTRQTQEVHEPKVAGYSSCSVIPS